MVHGGKATFSNAATGPTNKRAQRSPPEISDYPGFSYLIEPEENERSALGANLAEARKVLGALHALLPNDLDENKQIPAGYTYLLQFVAHDLVQTTVPFWLAADTGIESRNMRHNRLQLDTLYGGGPAVCPMAFKPTARESDDRIALRLGRISDAGPVAVKDGTCSYRDLARAKVYPPAAGMGPMVNFRDPSQVFVADPRNDDSIILAQLTVLFSILHNALTVKMNNIEPEAKFAHARTAVLTTYYRILRKDLLPKILHEKVYSQLSDRPAKSDKWLWRREEIPLEFSHGAFRVGHTMVRDLYKLNERRQAFNVTEVVNGLKYHGFRAALSSDWIVEWAKLFAINGSPLKSLKLKPRKSSLDLLDLFERRTTDGTDVVTLRDWLSSAAARMLRVDKMADRINKKYATRNVADPERVKEWLETLVKDGDGPSDARDIIRGCIHKLAYDLPLPLYVLLEASLDPSCEGTRMGVVGSAILGEVFFRLIQQESALKDQIAVARDALGASWDEIAAVEDMPAFIKLAAKWGRLEGCSELPFIGSATK